MADHNDAEVTNSESSSRFEARVGAELAGFAGYRLDGDRFTFTHTEVDEPFGGQGIGSSLVRGSLDAVRAAGGTVVPECPFVRSFIEGHDEYADLVDGE